MYPEAYLAGIDLFNKRHFWHSHEQWENCWHAVADADEALFYKGIIQSAAALVHWQRGNPRGLRRNWEKSHAKLSLLPSPFLGLDLVAFTVMMEQFVETHASSTPAPVPEIHLQPQPE